MSDMIYDRLENVLAGIGGIGDKGAQSRYTYAELTDDELTAAYSSAWLPRKVVDIPVADAVRKWRVWDAGATENDKITAIEDRLTLPHVIRDAETQARLYGGSAVFIGTNVKVLTGEIREGEQVQYLNVISKNNIQLHQTDTDKLSPTYGMPSEYHIDGVRVHPSRLMIFRGEHKPDGHASPWGQSVLQATIDALRKADAVAANIATLIFEAKIDVFKIPNLMQSLGDPEFEGRLMARLRLAQHGKSSVNALVMDTEEEYEQKVMSYGELNAIMMSAYQIAAGAADIPVTRLLGRSASGLNATGDNDIRDYYDKVQAHQEVDIRHAMAGLDRLIVQNALGSAWEGIDYHWRSLWQLSETELADVGLKNAQTVVALEGTSLIPSDALGKSAVTLMTESGVMPGLQDAVDDFAAGVDEDLPDE